jgi:hypothetical protein
MSVNDIAQEVLDRHFRKPTLTEAFAIFDDRRFVNAVLDTADATREVAVQSGYGRRSLKVPPLNYRHFYVGACAVAFTADERFPGRGDLSVHVGWNSKEFKYDDEGNEWPKICAERRIGQRALAKRCTCIVALGIVAFPNTGGDGRSGKHGPNNTLDMCETCRDDIRGQFRCVYSGETRVVNMHYGTRERSPIRTVEEVMNYHGETWWGDGEVQKIVSIRP